MGNLAFNYCNLLQEFKLTVEEVFGFIDYINWCSSALIVSCQFSVLYNFGEINLAKDWAGYIANLLMQHQIRSL